jgi:hypothetical protein
MKTKLCTLLVASALNTGAHGNPSPLELRPVIEKYRQEVTVLTEKIERASYPDSVKFYAKKMMRISDDLEDLLWDISGEKPKSVFVPFFSLQGAAVSYGYAFLNTPGRPSPYNGVLDKIHDCAAGIRFFGSRNRERITRNLQKVRELNAMLSPGNS